MPPTFDASSVIDADGRLLGTTRYPITAGRLGVVICYDRHLPEYMRALALAGAEVVPRAGAVDEWAEVLYEAEVRVAASERLLRGPVQPGERQGAARFRRGRSFASRTAR